MFLNNIKNKMGFTLIEVIIAIFVITVGVGGAVTLINQTVSFTQITSSKLVVSYLAQEGIEIVKNIRDSNFLKVHKTGSGSWDDGLILGACQVGSKYEYEGDYNSISTLSCYQDQKLKIDGGFYKYSISGTETPYKRKITITKDGEILEVLVEVSWKERGREHKVIAQENLYKWWQ